MPLSTSPAVSCSLLVSGLGHFRLHTDFLVLDAMGVKGFGLALRRSFFFAWITTMVGAALTYYILAIVFPQASYVENKGKKFSEKPQEEIEQWSKMRRSGGEIEEVDREKDAELERDAAQYSPDGGVTNPGAKKEPATVAVLQA